MLSAKLTVYDISPPVAGNSGLIENEGNRCSNARSTALWRRMLGCMMTASTESLRMSAKAVSNASPGRSMIVEIAIATVRAASSMCARNGLVNGSVRFASTATRRADGSTSRMSSMFFAAVSGPKLPVPVTLPPGRERLAMRPVPSGSPACAMTIGISLVACFAAVTAGVCQATMMFTLSEERVGHGEAERFRGLEVDNQLVFRRRLNRQVGGLLALEDAID